MAWLGQYAGQWFGQWFGDGASAGVSCLVGQAVLDSDVLVDSLVSDVIDGLREALHPDFGVRAYRAYRVLRAWSGTRAGDGTYTDEVAELCPRPLVHAWDGLRIEQARCGLEFLGDVVLTEVSLTYTFDQLCPRTLAANQQVFIAITDGHGQGSPTLLYTHNRPPYCDRIKDMGWKLWLTKVEGSPVVWP